MVSAALFIESAIAFVNRSLNLSSKCQNPHVEGFHGHTQRQCDISPQIGVAGGGGSAPVFSGTATPLGGDSSAGGGGRPVSSVGRRPVLGGSRVAGGLHTGCRQRDCLCTPLQTHTAIIHICITLAPHTHTHTTVSWPFFRATRVSRYQKGKTSLHIAPDR